VWHFPAPTFANRSNRPTRIIWANELPNVKPAGFDPTYDCGPNAPNCYPYNRIATHVHGAHVTDDSDGLTTAWYTPNDPITGKPTAVGPDYEPSKYGPPGTYRYDNSQEASTVWYHDHAMGTTHLNTNQGMAGFFPITDANEDRLRGIPNPATKVLPTGDYELGLALQDRTFWPDGSLALPDTPVYNMLADGVNCSINPVTNVINGLCPAVAFSRDATGLIPYNPAIADPLLRGPFTASGKAFAPCQLDITGAVIPNTCPEVPFSKAAAPASNLIPYNSAIVDPLLRGPFTASSGTLEYFGNIPIVNGVAFGSYNVEPRMYRMRLLGGTDSRTWILQLQERGTGTVIPFWQVGSEQGFLNNPVLRTMITLMPGERVDVLVDFSALTTPGTKVVLANLGPDMPYGGVYVPADRSVDIPEIMEFVSLGTAGLSGVPEVAQKPIVPAVLVDGHVDTTIALRTPATAIAANNLTPTVGTPVRNVSLIEITDQYGRTMPTIDARGFMPPMVPFTEVIKLGDTEQWDIINTTVDSHPMHLHQTAFQLIDRIALPATVDPVTGLATGFVLPVTDTMTGMFTQPSYTPALDPVTGLPVSILPAPWELGWKDTIECPPGYVTRVKATFDIPGAYVWHCHILSHEEHDMMRPMVVVTPIAGVTLDASATSLLTDAVAPVTFTATASTGIAAYPEAMSFEYRFTVIPPAGVTVSQPTLPADRMTMIAGSTAGYSMIRQAVWTPPGTPGIYQIKVEAKAIGAADVPANVKSATLNFTVTAPAIAGVSTTAPAGTYVAGTAIPITLSFNERITSTGLTLTLSNGATINTGALTDVNTYSGTYTVAAGENTPLLNVVAISGSITDHHNNTVTNPVVPAGVNLANAAPIMINTPLVHPEYTRPILDPKLQPHWVTGIPNALANYFTYKPYATDAAAVAAGFPSGVCGPGPTQEDCYTVSVRQFQQNLGLVAQGSYIPGVSAGTPLQTTVWGYGSASNAPAVGPFVGGVWHFPAPTFQVRSNRPARITWANELPNVKQAGFDPTYDCGPNTTSCFPYNRIVTHVHGAHVTDDSDGFPTAWYTPNDPATGKPAFTGPDYEPSKYGPPGTYRYENSQEAGTIWYHDHSMGLTHLNTNQGMAGFFPITDAIEDALRGITNPASKVLPTGDYELGFALQDRTFWPDGSLAMPDTPIYNMLADAVNCSINPATNVINGICPAVAFSKDALGALIPYNATIIDPLLRGPFTASGKAFTPCQLDITGAVIPDTCPEVPFSKAPAPNSNLIPYDAAIIDPLLRGPFTAPSGTLEYFGNVPIVNGVAFGTYNIEPRVYRMRFIGGTDSRTWIMQLQERSTGSVIPFWQIGSEQGFLNNPVMRTMITLLPGERVDVLVDFSSLVAAGTKVVLANLGPDMPYGGVYVPADRSIDIPEIMEFTSLGTAGLSAIPEVTQKPVVPAAPLNIDGYVDTAIALRTPATLIAPTNLVPTVGTPVRNVSLIEITDQYGRTMPTIDSRGFMPPMVPFTEVIKLGDTEQWDIINTTVDSHPMHLHQTAFQLIDRIDLPATVDPVTGLATGFVLPVTDTMTGTFTPPTYTSGGVTTLPATWEQAWKDTIECPPGKVTRVKAKFDIPGVYVWHCHILSHEEHDMMRPMVVTTPLTPASTVTLVSSAPGNTQAATTAAPVTFTATAMTGIAAYPESMGFEYQFTVTPPVGVVVTQPTTPANRTTMIAGSSPGYSMIREATWTPPTIPGTYVVTVKAKAIGAPDLPANIGTGILNFIVAPPAISGVTTTAIAGTYAVGAVIPITMTFNQPVSSTGLTLTLNNGAVVTTGALTNVTTFTGNYTVAAGQNTPVGQVLNITGVTGIITDAAGNQVTAPAIPAGSNLPTALVTLDPTSATIAITSPALVNTAAATITGTATAGALAIVQTITVSVNNGPLVAATVSAGGTFSAPVTLAAGVNSITVTATDNAVPPKTSTILSSITLDTGVTAISVTTPSLVNAAATTITGTATPPLASAVAAVTVAVNNGIPVAATVGANGTFSAPATLIPGLNTITVTTTDNAVPPKVSTQIATITLDTTASLITATTPQVVNTATTTISGVIIPPGTNAITSVMVSVNNGPAVPATVGVGGSYVYSAAVTLANGTNTITAVATDNAIPPKVTTASSSVVLDTTAAMIAVTSPTLVNTAATTVTGIVTPGLNPVQTVNVLVNGVTVPATIGAGGVFSAPVTLAAGVNTITVTATDNAVVPKVSTTVSTVTLNTAATIITVTSPTLVNTAATTITGTTTPPGINTIATVTVAVNNNPPVAATVGAGGVFSAPITLVAGANAITVTTTDSAIPPQVSIKNARITLDTTAAMIAVTTPGLANTAATAITGTVTPGLTAIQSVSVAVNNVAPVTAIVGAGGTFSIPVTLTAGANVITVTATDVTLKQSSVIRNIVLDTTATLIAVTTPSLVNAVATTITGTATPPAANNVATVSVTVNNGIPVAATVGAGGIFSAPVTLAAGSNTIMVTATDNALPAKVSTTVTTIVMDPTATMIAVTSPPLVNIAATTITGIATPPAANTVTTVTVSVNNGTPITAAVGAGGTFSASVTLAAGTNTITVVSTDSALKQSVMVRNIALDTTATIVAVTTPPLVNNPATTITGTTTPPAANTVTTVTVTVNNGAPVTATLGAGGTFSAPVTLVAGANTIAVTATDNALPPKVNTTVSTIVMDTTATMIAVTTPPVVNNPATNVTGTTTPPTGGTVASVTVTVNNGTPVTATAGAGGTFTAPVTLAPGNNTIMVTTIDNGVPPKTSVAISNIVMDPTASIVTVNTPPLTNPGTTTVTGTVAAGSNGVQSVTVNGTPATIGAGGSFTAPITLTPGTNTITVTVTDTTGRQNSMHYSINVDTTLPVVNMITPATGTVNTATIPVSCSATDPVGIRDVTVNGTTALAASNNIYNANIGLTAGANPITVIATDMAGNQTTFVRTVNLVTNAPVTTVQPPAGTYTGPLSVTLTTTGGAEIHFTTDGSTPTLQSPVYAAPIILNAAATTTFTLKFFASDLAGNTESVQSAAYTIHVADLTGSITINNGALLTNNPSVTLAFAASDPAGVPSMQVACDGLNFGAAEPFAIAKTCQLPAGDGLKTVAVKFIDGTGTVYAPLTASITLDGTPPVTTASPAGGVYEGTVQVALTVSETGTTYFTTNGTAPTVNSAVYSVPITLSATATQTSTLKFFTVDQAGNQEAVKSEVYTIHVGDLTGSIVIDNGDAVTSSQSVILTLSASDPSGVSKMQFSNDGITYSAFEPYATTRNWLLTPGDGLKTVYVKFMDSLGIIYSPYTDQITLDTVAPVVTAGPAPGTFYGSVVFALTANKPATIYFTTDGTTPTTASRIYNGLVTLASATTTTFTVKYFAVDTAGNISAVKSVIYTVHVSDLTSSVKINNGALQTNSRNVSLTLAATDPTGVPQMQVACDGVNFGLPQTFATTMACTLSAGDGVKSVAVKFIDGVGFVYPPVMADIILDTTPPVTTPTPPGGTYSGPLSVELIASEPGSTIYYTIDGQPVTTASPVYGGPITLTAAITSTYTVQFFAVDGAGNAEQVKTATYTLHVDDLTSSITINNGAQQTRSVNVVLSLSATDPNGVPSMQVACDGVTFGAIEPYAVTRNCTLPNGDGIKSVGVKFIDGLNIVYPPTIASILLDTLAPAVTANPPAGTYSGTVNVTLTSSEPGSTIYYTTNGDPVTTASPVYTGPITLTATATTTYNVQFFAVDVAGNRSTVASSSYTLHVSDLVSSVQINGGASQTNTTTVTLALSATDPAGVPQMQVACDGISFGAAEPFAATRTCILSAGDGVKNVAVMFIDGLGTVYPPVMAEIILDTQAPLTTPTPAPGVYSGSVAVTLTASEPGSTIYYTTDGQAATTAATVYSGPINLTAATTTTFKVQFFARDLAGNLETVKSADYTLHVSDLISSILINNGASQTNTTAVTLTLSATDPLGVPQMQVACDGVTFAAPEPFATSRSCTLASGDGLKTIAVKFIDGLGTVYPPVSADITLNTGTPTTVAAPAAGTYSGTVAVVLTSAPGNTIHYTTNGQPVTNTSPIYTSPINLSASATTTYTVKYFATDPAGNSEPAKETVYTIHVDDLTGSVLINNGARQTNSANVTLTLNATDPAGVSRMQVACDGFNFGVAEPYIVTRPCTLAAGSGIRTVAVKYIDSLGVVYPPVTAEIMVDAGAAITTIAPPSGTFTGAVTLQMTSSKPGSIIYYTTNGQAVTTSSQVYTGPIALNTASTSTFNVQYFSVDPVGNIEQVKNATYIIHVDDLQGSVLINNGARQTNSANVSLTLAATDPAGVPNMQVACDGVNFEAPEPYATTRACTLPSGDGVKLVAVKFIDGMRVVYPPVIAEITLDTRIPVTTVTPGSGSYSDGVNVVLTASEAATIYYTIDGSTPTLSSPVYQGPISLAALTAGEVTVKYFAVDRSGNTEAVKVATYAIHTPDLDGVVAINNGNQFTQEQGVTLYLSAYDPAGVTEMQVSCDGVNYASVEPFAPSRACTLSAGDGQKTVLVMFKDGLGNWYPPFSAMITLDSTAPVTTAFPQGGTYSGSVSINLAVNENAATFYTLDGSDPTLGSPRYSGELLLNPGQTTTYTLKYFSMDQASNGEAIKSASYTVHISDLVGSIVINNGAQYTTSETVTLALSATDPAGVTEMRFSNDGSNYSPFEPYATSKAWQLGGGDGLKTVYVDYKDGTGTIYTFSANVILTVSPANFSGDLNGNGAVDIADALRALQLSVGIFQPTLEERIRGDVAPMANGRPNPDGLIDTGDVLVILKKGIGLLSW
jgi:FtsP/CotA-like multicopper oxidase with cupredoxin domain/uncharacterized protein YfaP (DUF2135 family)